MKILIVDDNTVILSVIEAILTQENHEVFIGSNGVLGYNQFLNMRPDLVVTDIEMPWQDGIAMVQAIRRHAPMVRTLYMTGNPGPYLASLQMEQRCHPVGIIHKPFTRTAFLRAVRDVALLEARPTKKRRAACKTPAARAKRFRESMYRAKFKVEGINEKALDPAFNDPRLVDRLMGNRRRAGASR